MTVEKWLGENNKLGLDIFNKKYRYNNESFIDFLNRVSNGNKTIYNLLSEKKFIPGGRILANINTDRGANTNCAVLPGNDLDSIEKIMDRCKEMALLFKQGIGLGFNVGSIRPKGAKTSDGGSAPGIIPFMELFSSVTGAIASGGRRGASLLFCDAYHPQIIDFCKCKLDKTNNITNANISIWVDDEFMSKAELGIIENKHYIIEATGESIEYILDYKKVIDTAIECGVTSAEPGILFSDTYKNNAITQYIPEYTPTGVNGCSEFAGTDYATCLLGSINLSEYVEGNRFDYSSLINDTIEIIVYLNKVLDDGIYKLPIQEMKDVALEQRQLGLGVMGLADTFIKLGIKYGSKDSCDFSASVMRAIASASLYSSSLLAKKNGCVHEKDLIMKSDFVKNVLEDCGKDIINSVTNNGLYNTRLLAIAPTGSLATMLGISSGIEPIYKKSYKRRTQSLHGEDVIYDVEHQAILDYKKLNPTASMSHIVDAHEIEWKDKLQLLSSIQKYVDNAISNTLNLHKGTTVDEVRDVYMYAWKNGLKGVAIYVDGSLDTQILMDSKDNKDKKEDSQIKIPDDTTYYKREIIHGCGSINIMIGYSNSQKRIIDVYGIPNSNGGCTLNITAQLVYISHILRTTNLKDIERAINGLTACPSYVISKVTKGLKNGKNCATAILETLKAFENEMNDVVIINKDKEIPFEDGISCKKCGALIALKDGCHPCPKCGVINCS